MTPLIFRVIFEGVLELLELGALATVVLLVVVLPIAWMVRKRK